MGFWNKLGKTLLTAAPYVAAPFTGGASLAAAPLANKAVGAWSARDAQKNAEKGIGPSSYDKYLGLAGDIASTAGAFGAFGKMGNLGGGAKSANRDIANVAKSGQQGGSSWIDKLGGVKGISGIAGGVGGALALKKVLDNRGDNDQEGSYDYTRGGAPTFGGNRFARQMRRQLGPVMGQTDQNFPNLAESIGQGRMDAMRDQPFRGGYDVRNTVDYDDDDNPIYEYNPMPRIGPNYRQPRMPFMGGQSEPTPSGRRRREAIA